MKKIKLDNKIKWTLVTGLSILIIGLAFMCYKEVTKVETMKEEKTQYTYSIDTDIKYAVNLYPNNVYEESKLGEDQVYLSQFIRSINNYFVTTFQGSESATITGDYKIDAQVASYITEDKVKKDIWSKNYNIVPTQSFKHAGDTFTFEKAVEVDYPNYNAFAQAIAESTRVNTPTEIRVMMTGNMVIETPYKIIEQPLKVTVLIPLNNSCFSIVTEGEGKVEDTLKETVTITLPQQKTGIILYGVLIVISIIGMVMTIIGTTPPTPQDLRDKRIRGIFTNHGSRMVGVDTIDTTPYTTTYKLNSIDDLVKIADELEKPVMYIFHRDVTKSNQFYVVDKESLYTYEVKQIEVSEAIQETIVEQPVQTESQNVEM